MNTTLVRLRLRLPQQAAGGYRTAMVKQTRQQASLRRDALLEEECGRLRRAQIGG
jgi:hypothetical protein